MLCCDEYPCLNVMALHLKANFVDETDQLSDGLSMESMMRTGTRPLGPRRDFELTRYANYSLQQ
jgi:hypothetical protein